MKMLFVCFDQYPTEGACTSLLLNLFAEKQIQSLGEVHVLTLSPSPGSPADEIRDGIAIHRFYSISQKRMKQLLVCKPKEILSACSELLYRAATRKNIYLPCYSKSFYDKVLVREALARLNALYAEYRFDLIIPVCGFYESAVASLLFCKKNKIPLGFYQVDPCSTSETMNPQSRKKREAFEKELYGRSAFVITTDIIKREVADLLHVQDGDKIHAMEFPNIRLLKTDHAEEKKESDQINCVFAGRLYPKARNPRFTFELFSRISNKNIKLILVGVDRQTLRDFKDITVPDNAVLPGSMPISLARRELEKADFLVNIGNTVSNQVPSKLFEYFSSGKPVINIVESPKCPSLKYTKKHPCCMDVIHGDETESALKRQAEELERFIVGNTGKSVSADRIHDIFYECMPEYCAQQFKKIIAEVF